MLFQCHGKESSSETSENNEKTLQYVQTTKELIFEEVNNNNKIFIKGKQKFCHSWAK